MVSLMAIQGCDVRLVLIKIVLEVVLEAILFCWINISWSPKGILGNTKSIIFDFPWLGYFEKKGIPWVNWEILAVPKCLGG